MHGRPGHSALFARALLAFLALPGIVAFAVPAWIAFGDRGSRPFDRIALAPLITGSSLLIWCVLAFYHAGRGTLAPWDPPRHLVTSGPYRVSRNPMYVSVACILVGWAVASHLTSLWVYTGAVVIAFHLRVVLGEEPWLAQTHGAEWTTYVRRVRRWL